MVVIALTAERIPAALHLTIGTNHGSAVCTFRYASLAARHTHIAITGSVLDLAEWIHVEQPVFDYRAQRAIFVGSSIPLLVFSINLSCRRTISSSLSLRDRKSEKGSNTIATAAKRKLNREGDQAAKIITPNDAERA